MDGICQEYLKKKSMYLNKQIFTTYALLHLCLVIAGMRMILSNVFTETVNLENSTLCLTKLFPMISFPIKREYGIVVATGITWQFNCVLESVSTIMDMFCAILL